MRTGVSWFDAKASIVRPAIRAYLASPTMTLVPTAYLQLRFTSAASECAHGAGLGAGPAAAQWAGQGAAAHCRAAPGGLHAVGVKFGGITTCTRPQLPSTCTTCPVLNAAVMPRTPMTAGMPYSRATIAPWEKIPPTSVTTAYGSTNLPIYPSPMYQPTLPSKAASALATGRASGAGSARW